MITPYQRSLATVWALAGAMLLSMSVTNSHRRAILLALGMAVAARVAGEARSWRLLAVLALAVAGGWHWTEHGLAVFLALVLVPLVLLVPAEWPWGRFGKAAAATLGVHLLVVDRVVGWFTESHVAGYEAVVLAAAALFTLGTRLTRDVPPPENPRRARARGAALGPALAIMPFFGFMVGWVISFDLGADPGANAGVVVLGGLAYATALTMAAAAALAWLVPAPSRVDALVG